MLNIYLLYFFLCFRLMKDLLIRTINQKRLIVNTLAVQQFEFLILIFFQEFSSGVFGLLNVTLSKILWCVPSVLNNCSAHWKACVLVKRKWLM